MLFKFELEGGNFSKAGYASSQIKKVLKQLAIRGRAGDGIWCRNGTSKYEEERR